MLQKHKNNNNIVLGQSHYVGSDTLFRTTRPVSKSTSSSSVSHLHLTEAWVEIADDDDREEAEEPLVFSIFPFHCSLSNLFFLTLKSPLLIEFSSVYFNQSQLIEFESEKYMFVMFLHLFPDYRYIHCASKTVLAFFDQNNGLVHFYRLLHSNPSVSAWRCATLRIQSVWR